VQNVVVNMCEKFITIGRETTELQGIEFLITPQSTTTTTTTLVALGDPFPGLKISVQMSDWVYAFAKIYGSLRCCCSKDQQTHRRVESRPAA